MPGVALSQIKAIKMDTFNKSDNITVRSANTFAQTPDTQIKVCDMPKLPRLPNKNITTKISQYQKSSKLTATSKVFKKTTYVRQQLLRQYDLFALIPIAVINFIKDFPHKIEVTSYCAVPLAAAFGIMNFCAVLSNLSIYCQAKNSLRQLQIIETNLTNEQFKKDILKVFKLKNDTSLKKLITHLKELNIERKNHSTFIGILKAVAFTGHIITIMGLAVSPILFIPGLAVKLIPYMIQAIYDFTLWISDKMREKAYKLKQENKPLTGILKMCDSINMIDYSKVAEKVKAKNEDCADFIIRLCEKLPAYSSKTYVYFDTVQDLIEACGCYDGGNLINEIMENNTHYNLMSTIQLISQNTHNKTDTEKNTKFIKEHLENIQKNIDKRAKLKVGLAKFMKNVGLT